MVHCIEDFFGCYLLYSVNPKFKGRTYIGFTVNPKRRIAQHNAGKRKGGAWRTSGRGPWDMTLIVHGFPSDISALGFEWAWQHPESSRRLRHLPRKGKKETSFLYRIRVLSNMLCERPWCVLPLTVRWLQQKYCTDLDPSPPPHISYAYGLVDVKDSKKDTKKTKIIDDNAENNLTNVNSCHENKLESGDATVNNRCFLCSKLTSEHDNIVTCYEQPCGSCYHIKCLADQFLNLCPTEFIPIEGSCPKCSKTLLWGELVRKAKGFNQYLGNDDDFES